MIVLALKNIKTVHLCKNLIRFLVEINLNFHIYFLSADRTAGY